MVVFISWIYVSLCIGVSIIAHSQERSAPIFFLMSLILTPIGGFLITLFLKKSDKRRYEY
ncbi:hypothetical protein EIJ81_13550 [Aliivibrio salmonicida]|jgi:ABC-type Na+ efflux pump permease subunit|uniref:hypothetical protein n=1 Tax=Aliivibrio salmonicida TaxID=40269 RepID=UPI00031A8C48|nr:hypothetical protein [Aliivibrio salmonicida]AZL85491.1 hypothetical protein EIJ81_13550 [Aliivibrio salmonicida]